MSVLIISPSDWGCLSQNKTYEIRCENRYACIVDIKSLYRGENTYQLRDTEPGNCLETAYVMAPLLAPVMEEADRQV